MIIKVEKLFEKESIKEIDLNPVFLNKKSKNC
jgi:hypothetical protein